MAIMQILSLDKRQVDKYDTMIKHLLSPAPFDPYYIRLGSSVAPCKCVCVFFFFGIGVRRCFHDWFTFSAICGRAWAGGGSGSGLDEMDTAVSEQRLDNAMVSR